MLRCGVQSMVEAMFALMAAMVGVGILRRKSGASEIGRDAVNTLFLVATALAVQLLNFYVTWDMVFTKYLPDLNLGLNFFLDMLQTTAFWPTTSLPLAILLPFVALLAAKGAQLATRLMTRSPLPDMAAHIERLE